MGDINYMTLGERELFNVARTARLARAIGLDTVRIRKEIIFAIEGRFVGYGFGLGGFGEEPFGGPISTYDDVTQSPWYSESDPASIEFAGILPLAVQGLDDSSREATTTEYITDGGSTGSARNSTQTLVASVVIVATTDRGAEYGKRYLDRVLRDPNPSSEAKGSCSGADLSYFRYMPVAPDTAPLVHRRNVSVTRGTSITRRKFSRCSSAWLATFTLTAGDPYEYGEPEQVVDALGYDDTSVVRTLTEQGCATFDYSPIYDPLYPALVESPTAPDFLPSGWTIAEGLGFKRAWANVSGVSGADFALVPLITLRSDVEARMVRISVWQGGYPTDSACGPLWSAVVSYLPADTDFYVDGEQKAAYTWDGTSPYVRRTDSLVYSPDAGPVEWGAFTAEDGLLVTLDTFALPGGGYQGNDQVKLSVSLIPKSD